MPIFALTLTADILDGATVKVAEPKDFSLRIKFQCTSCNTVGQKFIVLSQSDDKTPIPGSQGESTYVQKCGECKAVGTADFVAFSLGALGGEVAALELCRLECRGIAPEGFQSGDGYTVASTSSDLTWEGVSFLEEDTFNEYDTKTETPVEVAGLKGAWKRL